MGKYFENATLDDLWDRLVNATESVTGAAPAYRWVIEDIKPPEDMPDYEPTFLIEGDYLTTIGDVYTLEGVGPFHTTFPISLSELDTNKTYKILDTPSGLGTGTLVYKYASGLKNTGLTGIHDALILYTGLIHDHFPTTPGDYMKGISVAANYYTNNNEMDSTTKNTLAEIVDRLEHSCYLSDDMVLTIGGSLYESGFRLFDADTEEQLVQEDNPSDYTTYDLKNYYQFQYGKRYYAIADLVMEYYDEDEDLYYHQNYYIRSNEVVYGPTIDYIFTLSDELYLTGDKPITMGDIYLTLYRNNELVGQILGAYGDVPYDFLNGEWSDSIPFFFSGNYYATISWYDHYGEKITYTTNVVRFDGSNIEHWLFQNEHIYTTPKTVYDANNNPIVPVAGMSYTVFYEGYELGTTEFEYEQNALCNALIFPGNCCIAYNDGWYFFFDPPSGYITDSGIVSIRINDPGMARVNITVENSGIYASNDQSFGSSLAINGVTYNAPAEITVPIGTNIGCSVSNNSGLTRSYHIYLNNVEVTYGTNDRYGASYTYTVKGDTDIILRSGATMGQYGPTGETTSISIVEL